MIPETEVVHQDPYAIDAKLDFLCGLKLLPTPLVIACPNATKKWLKASVPVTNNDVYTSMTGINSCDPSANLSHSVRFESVFMHDEICHSPTLFLTGSSNKNILNDYLQIEESEVQQPVEEMIDTLRVDHTEIESFNESMKYLEVKSAHQKDSAMPHHGTVHFYQQNKTLIESVKTNNMSHSKSSFNATLNQITNAEIKSVPSRVQNEIFEMEINQTIFSLAAINKSQGYLSDMLQNCSSIMESGPKSLSSSYRNLLKMINFLQKPCEERKMCYQIIKDKIKNKKGASYNPPPKQRTKLSDDIKAALIHFYHVQNGKITKDDIEKLATQHSLTVQNIKIFFKNMKLRKKL